jgi:hypothetical protein
MVESPAEPRDTSPAAAPQAPAWSTGRHGIAVAIGLGCLVLVFYLVEASLRRSPWLFTDELEWSQLSRAIASTGHAARRGEPHSFESLYSYLIAPAWWLHSTSAAYTAVKSINAVVMCLTAVPAYLLARMLVSRSWALAVALLSIAIPAMGYATSIVPESLAYLWFTTAALFAVGLLARPAVGRAIPAVLLAVTGLWVRSEFVALPASLVLAAAIVWIAGRAGDGIPWRRVLLAGAALVAFAVAFDFLVVQHVQSWSFDQYFNHHTLRQGSLAAGALVIGLGFLPAIGGIASLWLPERAADPAYRAFAAYLGASIVTLGVYTAAKSTYLVANLQKLIEERNLFYLSPLLLLGTALVLGARRVNWFVVAGAGVLVLAVSWSGLLIVGAPYFEAPGLAILTIANRQYWDINDFHWVELGAVAATVALFAFRGRRWVVGLTAVLVGAWLLTGQIYVTKTNSDYSRIFSSRLPAPRDWVDQATGGSHVTFVGEALNLDPTLLWLAEFWNRSIDHVDAIDGTAPGPGPALGPGLESGDGALQDYTGDPYTLAGPGVQLAAPIVEQRDGLTLYRTPTKWHLLDEQQNVFGDGWATSPIGYTYFPHGGPGTLKIDLSRTAYTGNGPPGRATIRVGTVKVDGEGAPTLGRTLVVRHALVRNGGRTVVRIHVPSSPVTVQVNMTTFRAPRDARALAAQPSFEFVRDSSP